MTVYLAIHPDADVKKATIWEIDQNIAKRIDSVQQEKVLSSIPNIVVEHHPGFRFEPLKLAPGTFFPRIARPTHLSWRDGPGMNPDTAKHRELIQISNGQLVALKEALERICRVIHPIDDTMPTFGHDIRNLLILAATEVETHWKGVLKANGATANTTNDYVKLSKAMQLRSYAVTFPYFPWMKALKPFENWKPSTSPTKDLAWYDAYNAVKHDREQNFPRASLLNAFNAVCASFVMLCAQFGMPEYWARPEIRSFFKLSAFPKWDPAEVYCLQPPAHQYTAVNFQF
jgi:hypothetical protein